VEITWSDRDNARAYARYSDAYPTYRQTSRDLVCVAGVGGDARVLDLACGSGNTTVEVLAALGPGGRVIGVDASAAMLAEAAAAVGDTRARWVRAQAEEVDRWVADPVGAAVCNSAIWQTSMPDTFAAVRRVLAPGGRFAFNIGSRFLAGEPPAPSAARDLVLAMTELARRELGWRPPARRPARPRQSAGELRRLLLDAGYEQVTLRRVAYPTTLAEQHAWLSVPIFTEAPFPGLPWPDRKLLLDAAFRAADPAEAFHSEWMIFVAV
jgi:ubiquinone/menaquinone biosynthesis C-methylase UbiE